MKKIKMKNYAALSKVVRKLVTQKAIRYTNFISHVQFILNTIEDVISADERGCYWHGNKKYLIGWMIQECNYDNLQIMVFVDALRKYGFMNEGEVEWRQGKKHYVKQSVGE